MNNPYFLLWLEAPLQSWGFDSRFNRRDSLDFPTKSGVLGLICCARGAGGPEREWLARWASLDMQVQAYVKADADGRPTAREPLLRDFHMVGSGYDEKDPWQSLLVPKTSEGKKSVGGGSKLTHRYYLQDMAYAVVLEVPPALAEETAAALQAPVWDLYLGRKSCAPTDFIYRGQFNTAQAALDAAGNLAAEKQRALDFLVRQGEREGEVINLNDVPVQFGPDKRYRDRRVTVQRILQT